MNRLGVVKKVLSADGVFVNGDLVIKSDRGTYAAADSTVVYDKDELLYLSICLGDGKLKQLGVIDPRNFSYKSAAYVAATSRKIRIGYNGTDGMIVSVDPTLAANVGKFGTLTIQKVDLEKNAVSPWGDMFSTEVLISNGETATTLYNKLKVAADAVVAKVNAKYGVGTASVTKGVPVINAASSYLEFTFAAGQVFNVSFDGIFEDTLVRITQDVTGIVSNTGTTVRELEKEAAILDGYNPTQNDASPMFSLDNYLCADPAKNYDCVIISAKYPKQYGNSAEPAPWEKEIELYIDHAPAEGADTVDNITELLDAIAANNQPLMKAAADVAYAAHA